MRQIGTLDKEKAARRFTDFLVTLGIRADTERDQGVWVIWVRDEDHLEQARSELENFRRMPEDPRYANAAKQAQLIRDEDERRHEQVRRNTIEMRQHWKSGLGTARRCPAIFLMIGISIVVFLLTDMGFHQENETFRLLQFRDPGVADPTSVLPDRGPWFDVRRGQVWRLVTPIFVHGDFFHLLFNMMWLHYLGGQYEHIRGSLRFLWFALGAALASVLALTFVDPGQGGGGMSGVNYALFGYIWMRWKFAPEDGFHLTQFTVILMVVWFFLCFTPAVSNVANYAHAFGLGYGMIFGYLPLIFKSR